MIRRVALALVVLALPVLAACSAEPDQTSCGDYLTKSENDKWDLIKSLAKQGGESVDESERGEFVVMLDAICDVHRDKTIKDAMDSLGEVAVPTAPPAAP